jgi:hypothetical protein
MFEFLVGNWREREAEAICEVVDRCMTRSEQIEGLINFFLMFANR